MIQLSQAQILALHEMIIDETGGSHGLRDQGALDSASSQPLMTFGGQDLYPTLAEKAAAMGFSLIANHPFVDGNKRIGIAAVLLFLRSNGQDIDADINDRERIILAVAAGEMEREAWTNWVQSHLKPFARPTN